MTSRIALPGEATPLDRDYGGYKVGVGGSRNFTDKAWMFKILDDFHSQFYIETIISGGARGADEFAEDWAKSRQIAKLVIYFAQWDLYGKAAGPNRNIKVVTDCEVFFAFPSKESVGTYHAIEEARLLNRIIYVFGPSKRDFTKYIPE